ncbi:MAG: acyl-CoA dehydrogenase family protein [Chloroflexota bacterium]|nr:acyl-CoA dehydrogenase family protein [Chloroflexota bacterium]
MTSTVSQTQETNTDAQISRPTASVETAQRSTNIIGDTLERPDFYAVDELLTDEERATRDKVRAFADREVIPIITPYWERAEFPMQLIPKFKELGIAGGSIRGYGCPGLSPVADGLVATEMSRGDASVSTFFGVHSGLAMGSIYVCGTEEQRQRWLPPMARLEILGAFGLTEPFVGSDAAHIQTTARREGNEYVLDGAKRWIGLGHIADIVVIWARDLENDGKIAAFVVEKGTPGMEGHVMAGKLALRALGNADITLKGVRVPVENRLGNSRDFRDTGRVLTLTRYGVACGAVGNAIACYEAALAYTTKRQQFGKPVAAFQLIQQKLVWMLTEITAMQLLTWRLGRLLEAGKMTPEQASMAKLNNTTKARAVASQAREIMGGNGILLDNIVIRHQADLEAIYSYEGTAEVQTLVVGRKITGHQAFA